MGMTQSEKNKAYAQRMKARGLVQVHPWVPADRREEILEIAEEMKAKHLAPISSAEPREDQTS